MGATRPAVGNHLWQSHYRRHRCRIAHLALRRNHARARYWLWLAASVKFLIPFSLLAFMGSRLPISRAPARTTLGMYSTMEQIAQPFAQASTSTSFAPHHSALSSNLAHFLPALVPAAWLIGFLVVLSVWFVRSRRISATVRGATPLRQGREWDALRRLERLRGIPKPIVIFLSRASLEPGIFGIVRPALLWPQGISARLDDAHLETILAHEVSHVRSRDNLAAAMHMLVQAIFWFYPLVWWLGVRLVTERERACDEEVLSSGAERQVYAESILKICEFCVGSPLAGVSGVTGADLKKRIARIMTDRGARKLDFSRKLSLSAAGFLAIALPILFGVVNATRSRAQSQGQNTVAVAPSYDVVSIKSNKSDDPNPMVSILFKRDTFTTTNFTLRALVRVAYGVQDAQISAGLGWLNSEKYDIDAKLEKSVVDELQKLSPDQRILERKRMLQAFLADRFKLTLHRETKELPVYELVVAADGSKLQEAKPGDTYPNGIKGVGGRALGAGGIWLPEAGHIVGQAVAIPPLVEVLSERLGDRIVVDKTGLAGKYDFTLTWMPDTRPTRNPTGTEGGQQAPANPPTPESSGPAIFTAIQEQLGLKLELRTEPTEILVIDDAEKPSEN